jgi:hypothetical protein
MVIPMQGYLNNPTILGSYFYKFLVNKLMLSCGIAPESGPCISQAAKLYFTSFSHIITITLPG